MKALIPARIVQTSSTFIAEFTNEFRLSSASLLFFFTFLKIDFFIILKMYGSKMRVQTIAKPVSGKLVLIRLLYNIMPKNLAI